MEISLLTGGDYQLTTGGLTSVAAGNRIIGIVKWKSGSSELDCQLTTG